MIGLKIRYHHNIFLSKYLKYQSPWRCIDVHLTQSIISAVLPIWKFKLALEKWKKYFTLCCLRYLKTLSLNLFMKWIWFIFTSTSNTILKMAMQSYYHFKCFFSAFPISRNEIEVIAEIVMTQKWLFLAFSRRFWPFSTLLKETTSRHSADFVRERP